MNRIINLHPKLLQKDKKRLVRIGGMVEQIPEGAIITKSGKYVVTMDGKYILTKSGFIPNNALKTNSGIPIVTTTGKYITI